MPCWQKRETKLCSSPIRQLLPAALESRHNQEELAYDAFQAL